MERTLVPFGDNSSLNLDGISKATDNTDKNKPMDVNSYLRIRTKFIRDFYNETSFPFAERIRKIEAGEEPFEPPVFDEYSVPDEPPFFSQWLDAKESLDVLGQMCISMLSSALQLYLKECINALHRRYGTEALAKFGIGRPEQNKAAFKKGWINGYRVFFRDKLGIDWKSSPSELKLLEEIVLARNNIQHPARIDRLSAQHWVNDPKQYPRSFFADEDEMKMISADPIPEFFRPLRLDISKDKLLQAIDEVEKFCEWLDRVEVSVSQRT
jgi:hypothetical protein